MPVQTTFDSRSSQRRKRFSRSLRLESLELRQLMAADITGTVYADDNRDGIRNNGENGVSGWTVFLDANKDGTLNAGETSTVTNIDGDYTFRSVAPGSVRVAAIVQPGWIATSPTSRDLIVPANGNVKSDFFVFSGGDIEGTVWNDFNQDGTRDSGDSGLAGWTVFLDLNQDGTLGAGEPSTLTDAHGYYLFTDLPPDDYEVTEVLPGGWEVSKGYDTKQTAGVTRQTRSTLDFANFSTTNGSIHGLAFNDINGNGIRDLDSSGGFAEPGLEGWTVFLDSNNSGGLDAGEVSVVTDENGEYIFLSLNAGDYEVTEVLPDGWTVSDGTDSRQTVAVNGGEASTADDFANFTVLNGSITGTIWNDLNRNGVRDVDSISGVVRDLPLVGWSVFLDLNRNEAFDAGEPLATTDANGNYEFLDLQVGEYEVREIVVSGWEATVGYSDNYPVGVLSGVTTTAHDFANFDASGSGVASVTGTIWNDLNGNGIFETSEPGLSGWIVFLDSNNDGLLTTGETQATTSATGAYVFDNLTAGTIQLVVSGVAGWRPTAPATNARTITIRGGVNVSGLNFGEMRLLDSSISGSVYVDKNGSGTRNVGDRGLPGVVVFLDVNENGLLDSGEPQTVTSTDLFYTPSIDESGDYSFTHLDTGRHVVRAIVPETLSATPVAELTHTVTIEAAENRTGVDTKAVYRPNEIHGVKFEDVNGNHVRDTAEPGVSGITIFVDLNRNNLLDAEEPRTTTGSDGSYSFIGLASGAYVLREITAPGYRQTAPNTVGGILWPAGTSNPAVGNVTPDSITKSLSTGESYRTTVSLTLPNNNSLTNLVDVFLLFDDTGSFTNNSPIVRAAFPDIISQLQSSLPGIDLGFGVGRMEEYANFAFEYGTGRPFTLNQPIVAASTSGYMTAIQAALNRTAPGYGGDQPETDIEALYQLVTGKGFDGNNNGTLTDSGLAGLASTQVNPGNSGDVPSFASFQADPTNSVMPAAGNVGGAGFRSGALPIVLLATDTGFAYQPKGESSVTGTGGVSVPLSQLTETSRPTTPYSAGAGIQETVTGLNALGALVIGLGTNIENNLDPRQQLEGLSKLTGAVNRSIATIANGTTDPIAPGDPLYFQIASGFGASVASGIVNAIQNAVRTVAVDIDVIASDPRVHIVNHTGILAGIAGGQTAAFDIEFIGDGRPHRFDLQFVRAGTSVVLGSIPVVLGTPIQGDCYEYDEIEDGELEVDDDFGSQIALTEVVNHAPSFIGGGNIVVAEDSGVQTVSNWATAISAGPATESSQLLNFLVSTDNEVLFAVSPSITAGGTLSFTPAGNAFGSAIVTVRLHDNGGTANGGVDTSAPQSFTVTISAVNDAPVVIDDSYTTSEDSTLTVTTSNSILANDSDIDGDALSVVLVTGPAHGTLVLNADGTFQYSPTANYSGSDSFTYKAFDGTVESATATVAIDIVAANDAPTALDDTYTTIEDTSLATTASNSVLVNDTDSDGDTLSAVLVSGPTHGTLVLNANGIFTYTPATNFFGADSFTYKVSDGTAQSIPATVHLEIAAVNDAPTAQNENYATPAGVTLTIAAPGVLSNDSDVEGSFLTSVVVTGPSHGTLSLQLNGSFSYTPSAGYVGSDGFTYVANDGGLSSAPATVTIQVQAVSGAPKFFVVDGGTRSSFGYDATGHATGETKLSKEDAGSRGIATSKDSSTTWVIDKDARVFVYNPSGKLLGSWKAEGIDKPEGITTDDTNIWIVDRQSDKVFYFAAAATRKSGELKATSSFALNNKNLNPMDIVAGGSNLWVINDTGSDQIFRYSKTGVLQGSWKLDPRNTSPTGLTVDPNNVNHIWVVDSGTDSVYQYDAATGRLSGSQTASTVFALASRNTYPQGISDPLTAPTWSNQSLRGDVNNDGYVTPLDALEVINRLNAGHRELPEREVGMPFWDVNDDGAVSARDALEIIDSLNRHQALNTSAHDAVLAGWFDEDEDDAEDNEELLEQLTT